MSTLSSTSQSTGRTRDDVRKRERCLTPHSLLQHHSLPLAAYLKTPTRPPGLDLTRPLMLYSSYSSTKVRACSLRVLPDGSLSRVGPTLVIPDSYTGWFTVLSPNGRGAPFYSTVEQLVAAKINIFLTRYDVTAYVLMGEGQSSYKRTMIASGNVLRIAGIVEDSAFIPTENELSGRSSFCSRKFCNIFGTQPVKQKFAKCKTFNDQIVYFPLSTSGRFFCPAHKQSKSLDKVYLISQLTKSFKLPCSVKLVCGYMPKSACQFTGLLRLEKVKTEDIILACTINPEASATLFEIEAESRFELEPVTDPIFSRTPIYLKTISYCEDESEAWKQQIKVSHDVMERRTRSLTRSLSDKFVEPLGSRSLNTSFWSDLDRKKLKKESRSCSFERLFGYPRKDEKKMKENKKSDKKSDRKLCKQNTYVFHLDKKVKGFVIGIQNGESKKLSGRWRRSFDVLDYVKQRKGSVEDLQSEEEEDLYAEIEDLPYSNKETNGEEDNTVMSSFFESLISRVEGNREEMVNDDEAKAKEGQKETQERQIDLPPETSILDTTEVTVHKEDLPKLRGGAQIEAKEASKYIIEGEDVSVISIESLKSPCKETISDLKTIEASEIAKQLTEGVSVTNNEETIKVKGDIRQRDASAESFKEEVERPPTNKVNDKPSGEKAFPFESRGRILMRGNTVVIRVKDTDPKQTILNENCVRDLFRNKCSSLRSSGRSRRQRYCSEGGVKEKQIKKVTKDTDKASSTDDEGYQHDIASTEAECLSRNIAKKTITLIENSNSENRDAEALALTKEKNVIHNSEGEQEKESKLNKYSEFNSDSETSEQRSDICDSGSEGYESNRTSTSFSAEEDAAEHFVLNGFKSDRQHSELLNSKFVASIEFPKSFSIKNIGNVQFSSSPEDDFRSLPPMNDFNKVGLTASSGFLSCIKSRTSIVDIYEDGNESDFEIWTYQDNLSNNSINQSSPLNNEDSEPMKSSVEKVVDGKINHGNFDREHSTLKAM